MVKCLPNLDSNLWYNACEDTESNIVDVKTTLGMETQSKCIGVGRMELLLYVKSKIEDRKQICLKRNKKENEGKPENEKKKSRSKYEIWNVTLIHGKWAIQTKSKH